MDLQTGDYTYAQWLEEFKSPHVGTEAQFNKNLAKIRAHNKGTSSYKMGVNRFTAIAGTPELKEALGRGYNGAGEAIAVARANAKPADLSNHVPVEALPASLDWRTVTPSVVTAVKDQGGCGGCWSFSAAETVESHIAIKTGTLFTLSEQEILACTPNPNSCGGTGGCSGATQELAFGYISQAGITTEAQWPYTQTSGTCDWTGKKPVANITGYVTLPFNNYSAIMNAVVNVGPIAISAAAEPWVMYESGVFNDVCGADVDHAIVLEGYGHDSASNLDYYLVRNSWSDTWGEKGYIRIARFGATGQEPCFTDNTPGDGDGCSNGPPSIQICGLCGILSDSSYPVGGSLL
jgi:cathepsin L